MQPTRIPGKRQIEGFHCLRAAAAFAVVWIHGSDTSQTAMQFQAVCAFAVPCFIMMSVFLGMESLSLKPGETYGRFVVGRVKRLAPAYLGWTLIYVFLRLAKHVCVTGTPLSIDWVPVLLFGAASYQLWFVPALMIWTVLLAPLMLVAARAERRTPWGVAILATALAAFFIGWRCYPLVRLPNLYDLFRYMLGLSGYVFLGMGIWLLVARRLHSLESKRMWMPITGIGLMVLLAIWLPGARNLLGRWFTPLFATVVLILSLRPGWGGVSVGLSRLSATAFGVYLAHAVFIESLQTMAGRMALDISSFWMTAGIIVTSYLLSLFLAAALLASGMTRWLVS